MTRTHGVLHLVRHGQSEWNRIGRIQGRRESPLTELGREQAASLGRMLRAILPNPGIDIIASPLSRAFESDPHRIAAPASNRARDAGAILGHMAHDQKTVGGRVHFVLLRGVGARFVDGTVPEEAVLDVLAGECRRS